MVRVHGGGSEESERAVTHWEDRKYYSLKSCGDDRRDCEEWKIASPIKRNIGMTLGCVVAK